MTNLTERQINVITIAIKHHSTLANSERALLRDSKYYYRWPIWEYPPPCGARKVMLGDVIKQDMIEEEKERDELIEILNKIKQMKRLTEEQIPNVITALEKSNKADEVTIENISAIARQLEALDPEDTEEIMADAKRKDSIVMKRLIGNTLIVNYLKGS